MSSDTLRITQITRETDLCALFIRDFGKLPGWTCYPEAAGFDILAVHDDGRQIGIEAKLSLNAKVALQVLPGTRDDFNGKAGPDYRLVIVSKITDASEGIARMLGMLGVRVLVPNLTRLSALGEEYSFGDLYSLLEAKGRASSYGYEYMFDWNPETRCQVPVVLQDLPAGVPAPVKLTPWKETAVKVVALMRKQGFITARQIAALGLGTTVWTQPNGMKRPWLKKGAVRGQWVETEDMPPFDKQHPALYEMAVNALEASAASLQLQV